MGTRYSIAEARNQLPAIVHDAERGSVAELTRRGKPVAVVLSIADYERLTRPRADFWHALREFRKTHDLAGLDVNRIFAEVRDRDPVEDGPRERAAGVAGGPATAAVTPR